MRFERIVAAAFAVEFLMLAVIVIVLAIHGLFTGAFAVGLTVLSIVALVGAIFFFRADRRRVRSRSVAHG